MLQIPEYNVRLKLGFQNSTRGLLLRLQERLGNHKESLPISAVCNNVERSFSKLKLIKAFHRSTVTDERPIKLAMISIQSETANTLDVTELTKHVHN